ncbi:alpha/beta fold hydrolase [uncultured Psychrobacter sp.]|jgi:predicted alpha/beta hydrolase|uniref:alpha/beta hydrolase family protein n=1 Tax=Psychrobacter pacificensis TaxID=112002 RepID=UPI000E8BD6CB|nr:alpha/beta fold hydrolase [uncultured Psychrobacter sp.]HBL96029.1 alpha/beta hydrolase [Psychrobacter sp.]
MDNHNAVSAAKYAESIINNPLISPNIADGATNIDTYSLSIMTDRNRVLAATVYRPKEGTTTAIMIAPATGIRRHFYHSFALYLAESGFGVLTFDNEGIGESLSTNLAKCDASLISWGRHDMPAVLDALQDEFPEASYHLIGHSAGGQLIGLIPNYQAITSVFNVACSSGRIKNMGMPYKLKAMGFMDAFIPLSNLTLGYTPSDKIGMGEPLPRGVARQWREWCNGAGYIKTAFGKSIHTHFYDALSMPALWLGFSDDDIANSENMDDMIRVFTNMPVEKRFLNPEDFGLNHIGHMRYFSSKTNAKAPELWQMAVDWFSKGE